MSVDEIKKQIEIEKRNFWKTETKGKEKDDVMAFAINKAYLDMQPRTIKGLGKVKDFQDSICEMLKNEFTEYFKLPEKDEEAFKLEHHRMCEKFLKCANEKLRQYDVKEISYGKAQKVVNMIFKYLYCTKEYGEEKKEYFSHCHMPLDSFSLEWINRCFIKGKNLAAYKDALDNSVWNQRSLNKKEGAVYFMKQDKGPIGSWSTLEYGADEEKSRKCTYKFYVDLLHDELENKGISPLLVDFYVWPRMQMILSAEAFIKTFKDEENHIEDSKISNNENSQNKENKYALENLDATLNEMLQQVKQITESAMVRIGVLNE